MKSKIEAIAEESKPKNIPKSNETQFPQTMSNQERIKRIREQEKKTKQFLETLSYKLLKKTLK